MFEAQLLNNNSAVYSPWMARGGDNLTFSVEVVDANLSSAKFEVLVFEKNSEDTGAGTEFGGTASDDSLIQFNAAEVKDLTIEGVKELVRYKFSFDTSSSGEWALFRVLSPVWFDDVKA